MAHIVILFSLLFLKEYHCSENVSIINDSSTSFQHAFNATHAESEFPEDLFTEEQRKNGAIVLHAILAVYCFLTIATVCTEYFMPTIQRICQVLKLSDDVAAATFMSIATSSPELFTNIIGTFVTNSDIGVGHVLGNAYYDMFFVAFLGGIAASKNIVLDWWPITRDCIIYLIVAATLTAIVWDGQVEMYETLILLALYVLYFVVMFSNRTIIRILQKHNIDVDDPAAEWDDSINKDVPALTEMTEGKYEEGYTVVPTTIIIQNSNQTPHSVKNKNRWWKKIGKLLLLPLNIATAMTIPDVRTPKCRNLYPISFVICVGWIGVSTYLGTWMISTIGATIGIPDIIMGMVFMAAGGSVVEAYGVYYKARRGNCSIGLSNSMGCNTLDATMCLALPWLVKILLHTGSGSSAIQLASGVLHVNCSLLIISVIVIFLILYVSRFTLNWKLGLASGIAYITILTIAIVIEINQVSPHSES